MSLLKGIIKALPDTKALQTNSLRQIVNGKLIGLNSMEGVTIYPAGNDQTFIEKGYQKNAWVYAIVSKCAKKFSQVPWYHYKIKTTERKTWQEYMMLTKNHVTDTKARIEARKIRTKAVDQVIVDSALGKKLAKPNRNESGARFRESLYGYKLLTGEGNMLFSRAKNASGGFDMSQPPDEWFIVPKSVLALVKGVDPWDIQEYVLTLAGATYRNPKDNILMWKFPSYDFDPTTLTHLRGMSPLDAGLLLLQSSNEGAERMVSMNRNQGAAGLLYNKAWANAEPDPNKASAVRAQINQVVNDPDMAGSIASIYGGDWNYLQFGLDANQLKLLEQSDVQFKGLCNIFDVPWQLFGNSDSYENRKQYKRDFVFDNIAVAAYSLRDEWNAKLIPEYNLDRERDVIDCDILALPELGEDQEKQAAFVDKMGGRLTYNEGRELVGYDRLNDPNLDKHYVQGGLQTLDQLNADTGGGLDDEMNILNA